MLFALALRELAGYRAGLSMGSGRFTLALGLLMAIGLCPGCETTGGGGGSSERALASIGFDYAARYNVEKATIDVLAGAGYIYTERIGDELIFRDSTGTVRFDVLVLTPEYRSHQMFCDAYELRSGETGAGAQWVRAANRSAECRQLLREIKERARLL